ncbi:MAG: GntR family transcriptional regulator [Treponemataceae bacterium]|jgi:DNA-binding GntR family transcriptional regulator
MQSSDETEPKSDNAQKQSLSQGVYEHLLEKFLQNELVPGNILNRREIAQRLGVSVAPVLEALLQLEMEGFVESIPRKGTLVKPVRQEDIFGQLMLREAVECQATRLYCGKRVREKRAALEALADELDLTASESPEHWKQEIEFHRRLVELSDCPALVREFTRFIRLGVFYRMNRILQPVDRLDRQSHSSLIEAVSGDDPDLAERAVRQHLRSGKQHLFKT